MARTKFDELKFREECINKEQGVRLSWYRTRHPEMIEGGDKLPGSGGKTRKKATDEWQEISQSSDPTKLDKTKEKNYRIIKSTSEKECEAELERIKSIEDEVDQFQAMVPAAPKIKDLLYDGISWEQKGRSLYLKKRSEEDPEHRFHYPITSSMEYGWNIIDLASRFDIKKPDYARRCIIRDTFYRKNGIPNPAKD